MRHSSDRQLLDGLTRVAWQAGTLILSLARADLRRRDKADHTPVTAADEASQAAILEGLGKLTPGVPIVAEESPSEPDHLAAGACFVVDPLDGTREFLAGRDEYTVNIALLEDGTPIAGVLAAPARGLIWRGQVGRVAERLALQPAADLETAHEWVPIRTRARPDRGARVLVSRSHLDPQTTAYIDRLPASERVPCGSALKFGLIADGSADLYPRLSPTSAWDVAAGHAVLTAAGGGLQTPDGQALTYGAKGFLIPAFIAFGDLTAGPPR
jgi:3'(2'), 5'-bisphosphate nucleotidase